MFYWALLYANSLTCFIYYYIILVYKSHIWISWYNYSIYPNIVIQEEHVGCDIANTIKYGIEGLRRIRKIKVL